MSDTVIDLIDLAVDMSAALDYHEQKFGHWCHDGSSSAIIEYQLNRRNMGEEPKLLHRAAHEINNYRGMEQRLRDAIAKCGTTGGVSGAGLQYILDGKEKKREGFTPMSNER